MRREPTGLRLLGAAEAVPARVRGAAVEPLCGAAAAPLGVLEGPEGAELWRRAVEATPFQHPAWLRAWWDVFGAGDSRAFVWESREPASGRLEAAAAWSLHDRAMRFGGPFRRLQLLGQAEWIADAFPSEYAGLLVAPQGESDASTLYARALDATLDFEWDDLRVAYVVSGGAFGRELARWALRHRLPCLAIGADRGYAVDTASGDAEGYWAGRSGNARRALRGKRRLASTLGLDYDEQGGDADAALETLCRLHDARWGGGGMPVRAREFLRRLLAAAGPDFRLRTSLLRAGTEPVSASLNLDCADTVYNLQAGFAPGWNARLSLGKLHVGYEIDACFARRRRAFDMLVGRGMKCDYKAAIATHATPVVTCWIARSARARVALQARRLQRALTRNGTPR